MIVTSIKTKKVSRSDTIHQILDASLPEIFEKSIVIITSKIISVCQGRVVKNTGQTDKKKLVVKEADLYLNDTYPTPYGHTITVKNHILVPSAGIDESNANGDLILHPRNVQQVAVSIWQYLRKKHNLGEIGVLITDSHTMPLTWGVTGVGLAWCGFEAINDYVGKPDIYGRNLQHTEASILNGLASSAVVVMGEGNEQTPLALITDVPFVRFQNRPPTAKELKIMHTTLEKDIYASLLTSVKWEKGGKI